MLTAYTRQTTVNAVLAVAIACSGLVWSGVGGSITRARTTTTAPTTGGTLHIAYSSTPVSFDPTQGSGADWFLINGGLFNGLYKFDRTGVPQLDLAAGPPIVSADRSTWTFTLRRGVYFSNGMELTADDLGYSITRTLDPHLKPAVSWGQSFDAPVFQGAQDFVASKTKSVAGIQVLDRYTIRFVLAHPVAILPSLLAMSINFVVPRAAVSTESPSFFASHPVGTGPFTLQNWDRTTNRVMLVRNPHFFRSGKPYLDRIIADMSVAPSTIALRIEKGEVDGAGDTGEVDNADLVQARQDPVTKRYLVQTPATWADWLQVDVRKPLFKDPAIRQAIAMAINRPHLVKLLSGLARPATQIYMPSDPQYDPTLDAHPVYPYNPARAAALVKASGYHGQPLMFFYGSDVPVQAALATGIQQDLQQIGLNVVMRGMTFVSASAALFKSTAPDFNLEVWGVDFFDAYDVYSALLSCLANQPTSPSLSGAYYCDSSADSLVNQSLRLPLGAARDVLLRQAQLRILQSATNIPVDFRTNLEMVSPKVGGFTYEPIYGWQFENVWLTQ